MSLQPPPKRDPPSRVIARIGVLIVLVLVVGVVVWGAVINQRIALVENQALADLELENPSQVDGMTVNVVTEQGGPVPVVLLHDVDVAGGALWDGVVAELGDAFTAIRVDLPGFGLSGRIPDEGRLHTVASMAGVVASVVDERFDTAVIVTGVGLGGKVASEMAVRTPDLVAGLVLIDVDFWGEPVWVERLERLPFLGRPLTHTFETGGALGISRWAPDCEEGGWCPTPEQAEARELAASLRGSTDSLWSFRRTPPASLVPSDLGAITVPTAYVWSTLGEVPLESVERVEGAIDMLTVTEVGVWKAHLEAPGSVAAVIATVGD